MPNITTTGMEHYNVTYYREQLEAAYRTVFGDFTDVDGDSIFGHMIGNTAIHLANLDEVIVERAQIFDIDSAKGQDLDQIGRFLQIHRRLATYSRIVGTITGTVGTLIPAGSLVTAELPTGSVQFTLLIAVTIGSTGTVNGQFQSVEGGPINVPIGLLNSIDSVLTGWDSVSNSAIQYVTGKEQEKDDDYRIRLKGLTPINSKNTQDALTVGLLNIDGVSKCEVLDNDTDASKTFNGVAVPARSILCLVYTPTDSTPLQNEIATVIFRKKGMSIPTNGAFTVNLTNPARTIKYEKVTAIPVTVTITTTKFPGYDVTSTQEIKDKLVAHAETWDLGLPIDKYRIQGVAAGVPFHDMTAFAVAKKSGSGDVYAAANINYNELYTLAIDDITVNFN